MTKIIFYRSGGSFYGFEEQGHACYNENGDDVLCAAISAKGISFGNGASAMGTKIGQKINPFNKNLF